MSGRPNVPAETREAQARASRPALSAWVSANAGSGKTHVLAQRVIRLLLDGADPSRILCLTYTRAAAANMATRVFDNLARWAMLPDGELAAEIELIDGAAPERPRLVRARRLFALALETPGGLKIQTIHAFCEAVLHQFPLEANIAGHFEMLDSQMEEALVAEARREMIAGAASGNPGLSEAFAAVLAAGGEHGLEALLAAIVAQRDTLRPFIEQVNEGDDRFLPLFAEFGFTGLETQASLAATVWPDGYFTGGLARQIAARAHAAGKSIAADFAGDLAAVAELADPMARLDALRGLCLTRKQGIWVSKSASRIMAKGVAEHFPGFAEEFERFGNEINTACDRVGLLAMLEATRAALTVADWLIARYERLKRARGFLDFNDLITRTANLLAREDAGAWVHYKLDKGIDHILLDEAQDTSPGQWAVVKALSNEFFAGYGARDDVARTIFAVGDEKQSIYSFQGAEPEAFALSGREFRDKVEGADGLFEHVRLTRSFRSTEDVLSAVDIVFAVPAHREGLTRDPEPIEHRAIRENAPGKVEVWPSIAPEAVEEPDDWTEAVDHASAPAVQLARAIAETIAYWLSSGEMLEGRGRPLRPGDVMVLVRKRDRFLHALGRELKDRGVPVAGVDRLMLTGHIAVQDLLAIARVVLQPDDDLSLAALLKGPAFGFDEDRLMALAADRPANRPLLAALRLAAEGDERARVAHEKLSRWRAEAGFHLPFAFFGGILARDGLRRKFVARLGPEAGDVVDEFLNFCLAAERTGIDTLEGLVALLDGGGPEIKREMDQTRGEVRIMTTHAAKGLEAPVVFLVDSGSAPFSGSHLPRLMPFDPPRGGWQGKGMIWRAGADTANGFSRNLEAAAGRKAEQEYRRLLYVGMTRAEDRLIVCGYHGKRGQPDGTWHRMVEDSLRASADCREAVHPATGETVLLYSITPATTGPVEAEAPDVPAAPAPAPAALFEPLPPAPAVPRPLSPSGAALTIEPVPVPGAAARSPVLDSPERTSLAGERGTAAHRLLQLLPAMPTPERQAAARRYLARIGREWPEGEGDRLWQAVERILDDEGFAPLFAEGSRGEVAVMGTVEVAGLPRAVSGRIDRLVVSPQAVLIVDYKTNRPPPCGLAEVPESHVAQMALYRALLSPIYPGRPIRAALVYTERPALVRVPEDVMDEALARLGGT
jgi:ATP-dependent helicase/nuclease subunit A